MRIYVGRVHQVFERTVWLKGGGLTHDVLAKRPRNIDVGDVVLCFTVSVTGNIRRAYCATRVRVLLNVLGVLSLLLLLTLFW